MKIIHKTKKLSELIAAREKIHLNPAWQRGPVWSPGKQALLIDSIIRGYDIPMIYLRECNPTTTYQYEVIDGQQRLRSLWDYMDQIYTLSKDLDDVGKHTIAGKGYYDLPKSLRDTIANFEVVVAFVKDAKEPEISRLFSRMQMGVRLNPPELRNAVQTGLRHATDGVARVHPFFRNARIPSSRFKHQDYLAHAISLCLHSGKRDLKAHQLMDDYVNVTDPNIYGSLMADADDILSYLDKVNSRTSRRISQKWTFVDLYFLLYQNKEKLKKTSYRDFADIYLKFDKERLENNAEPENLLIGEPTQAQQDLYNYIIAFKIGGGERKNVMQRNAVLQQRFKTLFGG